MGLSSASRDVVRLEHAQNVSTISDTCRNDIDRLRQTLPRGGGTQNAIDDRYVEYARQALDSLSDSYIRAYLHEHAELTAEDIEQILAEMTRFTRGLWESRANLEPRGIGLSFREKLDSVVRAQRQKLLLAMKRMEVDRASQGAHRSHNASPDGTPPQSSHSEPPLPVASTLPATVQQGPTLPNDVKPPETIGAAILGLLWRAHPTARNLALTFAALAGIAFALWTTFPDTTKQRVIDAFTSERQASNAGGGKAPGAAEMLAVHGKILAGNSLPATLRVGLLWGLEDDQHYYYGSTSVERDGSFVVRLTSPPPDKALMFFTHKDWGASTPALLGKLGVAYIIAFEDRNDSDVYEADIDALVGASDRYVVTYLEGKVPDSALTMKAIEPGYALSRAVKPTEHDVGTTLDSLVPANRDTRVTIRAQEDPRSIVWPNWT